MEISELMDGIRKLDLVLPEFQREFVWTRDQAKQLMVSLFRGFPTGSLLFWKTDHPPDVKNMTIDPDKIGSTLVILDGQQRLTTLYLFTRNAIPPYYVEHDIKNDPRALYFDLDSGEFQYYQVTMMQANPTWVAVVDCFGNSSLNPILIATQKTDDPAQQMELTRRYFDNLTHLQNIMDRNYPIQIVPATATIDDAIDVFDLVNSQGTPLTKADLALAHITGKWPQARQVMKDAILRLEAKRFDVDLTFMVRCLTGVVNGRALFETVHDTPPADLQRGWELLKRILDYLVNVLAGHAHVHSTQDLNTNNVLVPVVVYLARHNVTFSSDAAMHQCIHWMYAASAWARYTSQTDQRLDHDIAIIQRSESPWSELVDAIIDQRGRITVKASDFEGRTTLHPLYRMVYVLAKSRGASDWFNGIPLYVPSSGPYAIHSHHIFAKSLLYSERGGYERENHLHKKIVNEIANRAFLTGPSNLSLGDTEPADYLPRVAEQYPGALEKQFVPMDASLWQLDRFEDFLAARRELMAAAINERMEELIGELETPPPQTLADMLTGENAALEYKSTMRWDLMTQQVNRALEKTIAKTVAGFLNSEGGTLLIGVADDATVLGIDYDLSTLHRADRDGYEQKLRQLLTTALGAEFSQYEHVSFDDTMGETVCLVRVEPSPQPVYLSDRGSTEFYVRLGNTTQPLDMEAAHDYISMHWPA